MRIFLGCFFLIIFYSTATCQGLQTEKSKIDDLVDLWKTVQNGEDLEILRDLYAAHVNYYGDIKTPGECIENVSRREGHENAVLLTIKSDIHYTTYNEGVVKCSFIKGVFFNHVMKEYPAYLVLKKINGGYKIVEEGDKFSDQKPGVKSDWGPQVPLELFLADTARYAKTPQPAVKGWLWGVVALLAIIFVSSLAFYRRAKKSVLQKDPDSV
jgi:hypothetical protein